MGDLPQHPLQDPRILLLDRAADLRQAERAQRSAMPLALTDLAADLGDAQLRHYDSSFFLRVSRLAGFSAAAASAAAGSGSTTGASSTTGSGSAAGASGVSTTAATAAAASSG